MSIDFLFRSAPFKDFLRAVSEGGEGLSVQGIAEPAKPYFLSCLVQKISRSVVFIRASSAPLPPVEEGCRFFLQRLSSDIQPMVLPPLADNPYFDVPPALDTVSSRMRFFYDLGRKPPSLVLTNVPGLLKPFPRPRDLETFFLKLETGGAVNRDELIETLSRFGYTAEDLIASPGEYAWRGGIVDVFSPWESNPFRIELSGSDIVSLREFDISSQKSVKKRETVVVPGLREFPASPAFLKSWASAARMQGNGVLADVEDKWLRLQEQHIPPTFSFLSLLVKNRFVPFSRYLRDCIYIIDQPEDVESDWEETLEDYREQYVHLAENRMSALPPEEIFDPDLWDRIRKRAVRLEGLCAPKSKRMFAFSLRSVPRFENKIPFFLQYMKKLQTESNFCYVFLSNPATRQRLAGLLRENAILPLESDSPFLVPPRFEIALLVGALKQGFCDRAEKVHVYSETDIFTEEKVIVSRASRRPFFSQFQDLRRGDYVVHTDYGIGVFQGLRRVEIEKTGREFIEIHYRDGDSLLVPVEDLNLVQKFSRVGTELPSLDKLGTNTWQKTKARAKKAVEEVAKELLALYAQRKALRGHAFTPAGEWEEEFSEVFEYEETDDQLRSIREISKDMESASAMDRLLCGDVGYGKTEVAMRAAFKAVMDGKQVAVLCPTTVLASQHLKTFNDRMILFPIRIEALTRLQNKKRQKEILEDLRRGFVDIIIGTHRLLSQDVGFKDLGLLVVDEEQRFGVSHKEKIKQLKANIDVLTLTATPIPRTLNMSLTGMRDISLIETPPRDRLAVHTVVTPFSAKLVASAVRHELSRGGQVYYIHNRVEDIERVAALVKKLVPHARVVFVHGQMPGTALEKRMMDFIARKYDVLVSTTIIENGIDIPLVNTLIVDRSDMYGLAQLYQLRGRVGRSSRQAFAYFLVPPFIELTPLAKQRLKALREFSELGSGFRLAAKDLEIRGAGHLLGHKQHGDMEAVGFDYYMHLLDGAIRELKGERVEEVHCEINLKAEIRIPEEYLPQINLRLNLYKRLASIEAEFEVEQIREDIRDRFGPVPESVENLIRYGLIKFLAGRLHIRAIDRSDYKILLKFMPETSLDWTSIPNLLKSYSGSLSPEGIMTLCLPSRDETTLLAETIAILKELSRYTTMN